MKKSLLVSLFAITLIGAAPAATSRPAVQDDGAKPQTPKVTKRRVATPADAGDAQGRGTAGAKQDGARGAERKGPDDAKRRAPDEATPDEATPGKGPEADRADAQVAALRAAFAAEYFARKAAAGDDLDAARERAGRDEAAFAAARAEIARKYRGELAALRTAYAEKAQALGVPFVLPADDAGLEKEATSADPAAALRAQFTAQVADLARAAGAELADAEATTGRDAGAFAAKRTEIARKYRGQVLALQQAFAQKAAGFGVAVDTTDVSKLMVALASDRPAPPAPAAQPQPRPAQPTPGPQPKVGEVGKPTDASAPKEAPADTPKGPDAARPAGKPIDAEVLRTAFTKQVEALRTSLASELATADATSKGDELAAKRAALLEKYRGQLSAYRATVAARAQAAGVALSLPTDAELAPELDAKPGEAPPETPKPETPKPETPKPETPKPDAPQPGTPQGGEGTTPPKAAPPKEAPPQTGPGGKRGRGPRFGGGNG